MGIKMNPKNKMKKLLLPLGIILLLVPSCRFLNQTCSYSNLKIETNTVGLKKIPLSESGINSYDTWLDQHSRWQLGCGLKGEYDEEMKWRDYNRKQAEILSGLSYVSVYQEINFAGENYYLFYEHYDNDIIIVNKESQKCVKKISVWHWTHGFYAKEIMLKGNPYLVIVTYYATWRTNTSFLYILDTDFNIVYKEILTSLDCKYGGDIGSINSDKYGNCIVIKTYPWWRRWEWKEWQEINGDWVYYLP